VTNHSQLQYTQSVRLVLGFHKDKARYKMTTTSNTNNKTTNNDVEVNEQVLKALKIAAIAIKDGIKEVCQIAVSSIKSNQQ
jgi:hypothetical protein